jgi:hypothetical protein
MARKALLTHPLFCPKEHRLVWEDGFTRCPLCQGELLKECPPEELSAYSKNAHNADIAGYNRIQNALCFVVLGGISLVIGILFIFLSLKKKFNKIVGLNFASFQFVICVVGLALGVTLLTIGLIGVFKGFAQRKAAKRDIAYLGLRRPDL